jgi:hypothetical protein
VYEALQDDGLGRGPLTHDIDDSGKALAVVQVMGASARIAVNLELHAFVLGEYVWTACVRGDHWC